MKGNRIEFLSFLVLAFFLFSSLSTSAHFLLQINHGEEKVNTNGMTLQADAKEDFSNLIGAEEWDCRERDEECEKRRVLQEAHLDYIYTQNNKP